MRSWLPCALLLCGCSVGLDEYKFDKGPCEPEVTLNDEFEGNALAPCWKIHQAEAASKLGLTGDGKLAIVPEGSTVWDLQGTGPFVFQVVGKTNFSARLAVSTESTMDPTMAPASPNHGAGVMIRDPNAEASFVRYEMGKFNGQLATTAVSTLDGSYLTEIGEEGGQPVTVSWDGTHAGYLLICRSGLGGERIAVARRAGDGASWEEQRVFLRDDLSGDVKVGVEASCPEAGDLRAVFDSIRFKLLPDDDDQEDCVRVFE